MIAEELRIGNWIHDPKHNKCDFQIEMFMGAHDFQAVTKDFLEDLTLKLDQCEPIPLTEEWLKRLGLRRNKEAETGEYQRWEQCLGHSMGLYFFTFFMNMNRVAVFRLCFETDTGKYTPNLNGVQYVHQLQNLYHALTGEELTLKD